MSAPLSGGRVLPTAPFQAQCVCACMLAYTYKHMRLHPACAYYHVNSLAGTSGV